MPADAYRCPSCTTQYMHGGCCQSCRRERKSYVTLRPVEASAIVHLGDVSPRPRPRVAFPGWPQVTASLNGGLPLGKLLLFFGPPGLGKTTLVLGLVSGIEDDVLYCSSEQEATDLREIGTRCAYPCDDVAFSAQSSILGIEEAVEEEQPRLIVVDSLQQIVRENSVVEVVSRLAALAHAHAAPMIVTCHVTKDDSWAGPRHVEHIVDGMAEFAARVADDEDEDEGDWTLSVTVTGKYRYGPVGRVARLRRWANGRIEECDG